MDILNNDYFFAKLQNNPESSSQNIENPDVFVLRAKPCFLRAHLTATHFGAG